MSYSQYGSAIMIAGILLLIFMLNRRGRKLKKQADLSDSEFEEWKKQFHTWTRKDNVHLNVKNRINQRKSGEYRTGRKGQ